MKRKILIFILVSICYSLSWSQSDKDIELVESIPVETMLDNPDIRNTQEVWLEMINSAEKTLDIEEFYVTNKKGEPLDAVLSAIVTAAKRGVNVRIIVDSKMFKTYPEDVSWLEAQSPNIVKHVIDFGRLAGGIQHAKYFIVDGKEVFIGSQNFDWRSLNHIHELGFRLKRPDAAAELTSLFNSDWEFCEANDDVKWSREIPGFDAYNKNYNTVLMPTCSPDLNNVQWDLRVILDIIKNSNKEVDLQFYAYGNKTKEGTWYELDSALINAATRGVNVKLIVADWNIGKNQIECLKNLSQVPNIEVKYSVIPEFSGGYISFARVEHCKYIAGDTICWIGSANAEKGYFYNTRNVGVELLSEKFAARVHEIFMKDWDGPYTHFIKADGEYTPREHGEK